MTQVGGEVKESIIINDLFPEVLCEAKSKIGVKTVKSGNYQKMVEIRVTQDNVVYKGYSILGMGQSNQDAAQLIANMMKKWSPGQAVPFRWWRTVEDAAREMGKREQVAAAEVAPSPGKPRVPAMPEPPPELDEVTQRVAQQTGNPDIARHARRMSRAELLKAAKEGQEVVKDNKWGSLKQILLTSLGLYAIVQGGWAGIAAVVLAYYAVQGIKKARETSPGERQPDVKDATGDAFTRARARRERLQAREAERAESPLRVRKR
jgi:hypothetical protein